MKTKPLNSIKNHLENESISTVEFSNKIIAYGEKLLLNTTNDYGKFYQHTKSTQDQLTDILTIGILWNNCNAYLSIDAIFYAPLFNFLNKRPNNKRLNSLNNNLKNQILLTPHYKDIKLYERFEYLSAWIKDNNKFNELTGLMESWQYWAEQLPLIKQKEIWDKIEEFAKWFTDAVNYYFEQLSSKYSTSNSSDLIIEKTEFYISIINELKHEIDYQELNSLKGNLVSA